MRKQLSVALLGLAMVLSPAAQAAQTSVKDAQERAAINANKTIGRAPCSLCFSCGGVFPVFSGSFAGSGANNVTERGSSCSGSLTSRTDSRPFLCCNIDR